MAWAKRIYILIVEVNKFISFFASRYFLKEIENMFFVFVLSYRNTRESLGELKKAVETLALACVPTAFLILPNFHLCFYNSSEHLIQGVHSLLRVVTQRSSPITLVGRNIAWRP